MQWQNYRNGGQVSHCQRREERDRIEEGKPIKGWHKVFLSDGIAVSSCIKATVLAVMLYYSFAWCYYWRKLNKRYRDLCSISFNYMGIYNSLKIWSQIKHKRKDHMVPLHWCKHSWEVRGMELAKEEGHYEGPSQRSREVPHLKTTAQGPGETHRFAHSPLLFLPVPLSPPGTSPLALPGWVTSWRNQRPVFAFRPQAD